MRAQELRDVGVAVGDGVPQRRDAVVVLLVDVRARLQQARRNFGVACRAGGPEGAAAVAVRVPRRRGPRATSSWPTAAARLRSAALSRASNPRRHGVRSPSRPSRRRGAALVVVLVLAVADAALQEFRDALLVVFFYRGEEAFAVRRPVRKSSGFSAAMQRRRMALSSRAVRNRHRWLSSGLHVDGVEVYATIQHEGAVKFPFMHTGMASAAGGAFLTAFLRSRRPWFQATSQLM